MFLLKEGLVLYVLLSMLIPKLSAKALKIDKESLASETLPIPVLFFKDGELVDAILRLDESGAIIVEIPEIGVIEDDDI